MTAAQSHHDLAASLRLIIERMHKHVGDRVYDLRSEAEALLPIANIEPVYTLNITPSTDAARERIAAGLDDPSLLRATLAQARDLSRDLGASIVLLTAAGRQAGRIEVTGDYSIEGRFFEKHR